MRWFAAEINRNQFRYSCPASCHPNGAQNLVKWSWSYLSSAKLSLLGQFFPKGFKPPQVQTVVSFLSTNTVTHPMLEAPFPAKPNWKICNVFVFRIDSQSKISLNHSFLSHKLCCCGVIFSVACKKITEKFQFMNHAFAWSYFVSFRTVCCVICRDIKYQITSLDMMYATMCD